MAFDFKKAPTETEYQYKYRVYQAKWSGLLGDMTWQEIANKMNAELRPDEPEYGESVYRKEAALVQSWYENMFKSNDPDNQVLMQALQKERFMLRDERTAINKSLRHEARTEQQLDYLAELLSVQGKERYPWDNTALEHTAETDDMVILLTDWHIGADYDNSYGRYNTDIAKERLGRLLETVRSEILRGYYRNAHIVLGGDMISGNIHRTVAVTNRENVVEQIKIAAEYLTEFTYQICQDFDNVYLYSVSGNHSRIADKKEALKDERLDELLPFIVDNSLSHVRNLIVSPNEETSLKAFRVKDKRFVVVHGDYDAFTPTGIANLSLMLGYIPDVILVGHKHTAAYEEISGVKVIRGGSLGGSGDDFSVAHRMRCNPSQTLLCVNDQGGIKMMPVDLT